MNNNTETNANAIDWNNFLNDAEDPTLIQRAKAALAQATAPVIAAYHRFNKAVATFKNTILCLKALAVVTTVSVAGVEGYNLTAPDSVSYLQVLAFVLGRLKAICDLIVLGLGFGFGAGCGLGVILMHSKKREQQK